eukprot:3871868-Alexandrium_andersonii.AAC.1
MRACPTGRPSLSSPRTRSRRPCPCPPSAARSSSLFSCSCLRRRCLPHLVRSGRGDGVAVGD